MGQEKDISDLIFSLITKHAPHYWEDQSVQIKWDFESLVSNISRELSSRSFDEIDAGTISRAIHCGIDQYLNKFSQDTISPSNMSSNPRVSGLREENTRQITNFIMDDFFPEYYKTHIFNKYGSKIPDLLREINHEISLRNYPPDSSTPSQQDLLGIPPSSR